MTSYLEEDAGVYRHCDPPLHSTLRSLIASGSRRIIAVEASGVLGVDTPYWSELTLDSYPQRLNWTVGTLNRVKGCDLVLLDPNNGIRLSDVPDRGAVSAEHAYKNEILEFSGQSGVAVIYHTPSRHAKGVTHEDQIEQISQEPHRRCRAGSGRLCGPLAPARGAHLPDRVQLQPVRGGPQGPAGPPPQPLGAAVAEPAHRALHVLGSRA